MNNTTNNKQHTTINKPQTTNIMKNYILFTTDTSIKAIDPVSMVVAIDEKDDMLDACLTLQEACKYDNCTAGPIGAPLSSVVFDMEHALEIIKSIKLHKRQRVVDQKKMDIIISKDGIHGARIFDDNGTVCIDLQTRYETGNPDVLTKEHDMISQIKELFGGQHVAYHSQRNVLELVRSDTEDIGIDWALVKGDVVQITKKYSYIEVEI